MDNTTDTDTTETGQEAKHDQWYAVKPCHANGWWIISRDPDGDDCVDASGDGGFNEPEAKLIAAAPDMLEALKATLEELLCGRDYIDEASRGHLRYRGFSDLSHVQSGLSEMAGKDLLRIDLAIEAARDAIAKAEGKS